MCYVYLQSLKINGTIISIQEQNQKHAASNLPTKMNAVLNQNKQTTFTIFNITNESIYNNCKKNNDELTGTSKTKLLIYPLKIDQINNFNWLDYKDINLIHSELLMPSPVKKRIQYK